MESEILKLEAEIPPTLAKSRLDQALAIVFPEHSRSRLKYWIEEGKVFVDDKNWRAKDKVQGGEYIKIEVPIEAQTEWLAEAPELDLDIVYEDEDLLIVNKTAGCVVHPAAGNKSGTLVNALLHRIPELNKIPRAGIVHRLDKDTTGLMVVAKTLEAQASLGAQLQARTVKRTYETVVWGVMLSGGSLRTQMGRHPNHRSKMAVVEQGKEAITHYRVLARYAHHSHLEVQLETGRTHQIRVHMGHINYPVVGDKTYGGRTRIPPKASERMLTMLREFSRQALHAKSLALLHPRSKQEMTWEIPLPEDMQILLKILREENV